MVGFEAAEPEPDYAAVLVSNGVLCNHLLDGSTSGAGADRALEDACSSSDR
jgi:hypothetical protein